MRLKKYRKFLAILLVLDMVAIGTISYFDIRRQIPNDYYTFVDQPEEFSLPLPVELSGTVQALSIRNAGSNFTMNSKQKGEYPVDVKLFGLISMKTMNVHVLQKMKLAPYGAPIGIYVSTKGLLVLDTGVVEGRDSMSYEPAKNIFQPGDYILEWNGKKVENIAAMNQMVEGSKGKRAQVLLRRGNENIRVRITPVMSKKGTYKIGVWVREDTQGIGTITYITEEGSFGALGHGITDSDTGTMIRLSEGEIYTAKILNVIKGRKGIPGELEGIISMTKQQKMGEIKENTSLGIYGTVNDNVSRRLANQFVDIAMKQKIKKGKAILRTRMDGACKDYEIQITDIDMTSKDNKGMVIKVTDKELLKKTGGIVQGMSGSPILQNGKIIGAVTHVFVNDSTKGYGIFIENMLGH
ncbi:MAG: SpoIVB peptidase [Lachnospiraceae bacterium]|nr:SpoIVB peptidase [Lachnospiraceae bacterium]